MILLLWLFLGNQHIIGTESFAKSPRSNSMDSWTRPEHLQHTCAWHNAPAAQNITHQTESKLRERQSGCLCSPPGQGSVAAQGSLVGGALHLHVVPLPVPVGLHRWPFALLFRQWNLSCPHDGRSLAPSHSVAILGEVCLRSRLPNDGSTMVELRDPSIPVHYRK